MTFMGKLGKKYTRTSAVRWNATIEGWVSRLRLSGRGGHEMSKLSPKMDSKRKILLEIA